VLLNTFTGTKAWVSGRTFGLSNHRSIDTEPTLAGFKGETGNEKGEGERKGKERRETGK